MDGRREAAGRGHRQDPDADLGFRPIGGSHALVPAPELPTACSLSGLLSAGYVPGGGGLIDGCL